MSGPDPRERSTMAGLPGPEVVATVLAVLIVAIFGASIVAGGPRSPDDGSSPSPTVSASVVPIATPPVDTTVVALLRSYNLQLVERGRSLTLELDRASLRTADVAVIIRQLNATVLLATDAVGALRGAQGPEEVGGRLAAVYRSIDDTATRTLSASNTNAAAYRSGASALVKLIDRLPALQTELDALASGPPPSPTPSPSVASSPSISPPPPTAIPTGTPRPSPSPSLTVAPSMPPGEQIVAGGFEEGVGLPWTLLVAPGSAATVTADPAGPGSGTTSARIDISIGSPAYSGISLRQTGLRLEAGARYTIELSARASAVREVRIRIASRDGASYVTRIAPVGTTWSAASFTFIAPVSDGDAVVEIDLGRSALTTWLDSVSFRPVGAPPSASP